MYGFKNSSIRKTLQLNYIYIEPHYGCNRKCEFCGIGNGLQPKKFQTMSLELAEKIAKQIPELEKLNNRGELRFEFAMRGEPTLNKQLPEIIKMFDKYRDLAEIRVLTNGDFLTKELVDSLFNAGCNIIGVDNYDNNYNERKEIYKTFDYSVIDEDLSCHIMHYYGPDVQGILMLRPTWERTIMNNQAGMVDQSKLKDKKYEKKFSEKELDKSIKAFCPRPFDTITIYHDGSLSICPTSWTEDGIISHIDNEKSLYNYFTKNKELFGIRKALRFNDNERICKACQKCDYDFMRFFDREFTNWVKNKH